MFGKQDIRNLRYARKSKTARSAVAAILDNWRDRRSWF